MDSGCAQCLPIPLIYDPSPLNDDRSSARSRRGGEIMSHMQQRDAAFSRQCMQQCEQTVGVQTVKRARRFIRDHEFRLCRNNARQRDSLTFAAAQLSREPIKHAFAKANLREGHCQSLSGRRCSRCFETFLQDLSYGHHRVERCRVVLEQHLNGESASPLCDLFPLDANDAL